MNTLISIITPAYNAEKFLGQTIQSVLAQTYSNWEQIVVIDAKSTDGTEQIAKFFAEKDGRIRIVRNDNCQGVANNRNEGLLHAKGELIAFLDADDLWKPEKLKNQMHFMVERKASFSCHAYQSMSVDGTEKFKIRHVPERAFCLDLLTNNTVGCLSVLIKKELLPIPAFFDGPHEDLTLWLKITKTVPVFGLDENLALYRIVPGSRSNNKIWAVQGRWHVLRHVEKLSVARSVYFILLYAYYSMTKRLGS